MEITREFLQRELTDYILRSPQNTITAETAYDEADIGQRMYDAPLIGIGSADDPLWEKMREPDAVGALFRTPCEWLFGARSVIVFFAPYSDAVIESNKKDRVRVGSGWLSAYRYGEGFLKDASRHLEKVLCSAGCEAFEPYASDSFICVYEAGSVEGVPPELSFTSNWSVRHAAYICGLGTFGLSRGFITRCGIAGRIGSVITTAALPADERDYVRTDDYCIGCGKCAANCPAGAITTEGGKDNSKCLRWLDSVACEYPLCDCCGKCQVNVPCERCAPALL